MLIIGNEFSSSFILWPGTNNQGSIIWCFLTIYTHIQVDYEPGNCRCCSIQSRENCTRLTSRVELHGRNRLSESCELAVCFVLLAYCSFKFLLWRWFSDSDSAFNRRQPVHAPLNAFLRNRGRSPEVRQSEDSYYRIHLSRRIRSPSRKLPRFYELKRNVHVLKRLCFWIRLPDRDSSLRSLMRLTLRTSFPLE